MFVYLFFLSIRISYLVFTLKKKKSLFNSSQRSLPKLNTTAYWLNYSFNFLYIFLSCLWKVYLTSCLSYITVLAQTALTKYHRTGWFKQQKFISSQFWGLEVQAQGVRMVCFWWLLSFWLIDSHLPAVSSGGGVVGWNSWRSPISRYHHTDKGFNI